MFFSQRQLGFGTVIGKRTVTVVPASSSPIVVPVPLSKNDAVDPEEAFLASLSSCHMLTFLAIAAKRKLTLDSYTDEAAGYLEKNAEGRLAMTRVVLRPRIEWAEGINVSQADLDKLHHQAHEGCFIANSVKTAVTVEPAA